MDNTIVGQWPTVLAVGAGGGLFGHLFSLLPSFWETARYRLKYCLKEPLNQKTTYNQQSNRTGMYMHTRNSVLQIKGDMEDKSKIIFLISQRKHML